MIFAKGGDVVDISVGDILIMKKQHPGCGNDHMKVLRVGADFNLPVWAVAEHL